MIHCTSPQMRRRETPIMTSAAAKALLLAAAAVMAVMADQQQQQKQIHQFMTQAEIRRIFHVDSHDQVPPYEVVRFRGPLEDSGGGNGRGGGGEKPPSTQPPSKTSTPEPEPPGDRTSGIHVVHMAAFGREHVLNLRRTEGLLKEGVKDVPTWTADKANSSSPLQLDKLPQDDHIGDIYQDEDNLAAVLLHKDPDGSLLLEGTIGHDLVVRPVPSSVRQHLDSGRHKGRKGDPDADDRPDDEDEDDDEMFLDEDDGDLRGEEAVLAGFPLGRSDNQGVHFERRRRRRRRATDLKHAHIVYKRDAPTLSDNLSDYAFMEPDALPSIRTKRSRRGIRKREAPYVIYPEILVIVDYDGYRLHGGDNVQIKRYFVSFWNGVDLRYKLLKGPRIRISIAGIIISRARDATPYLERNRVGRDAIDSAAALTDMGKYLFRERRLPVYDIAVAVTKLDMCRRQYPNDVCNRGTAGFAYVGGACVVNKRLEKVNSVAIIEDTGGFSGIIVAAHEVGHLLGAVHDGSPPPSYLGGPGAEKCRWEDGYIMSDLRHTEKGFRWSPCTVSSFHHFLNGDTATCLYNSPHEDESLPRVLPGKLLTLDAQCRKDRGTSACFKDDRVCAQLFCFDSGSGYCVAYRPAAEGSPCGDGQYCMNGKCVVEHENIIPDYSQNTPTFLRRSDEEGAATQPRPFYAPYNSTTIRSEWAEFWKDRENDITTTPYPYYTKNPYEVTSTLNPYEEYLRASKAYEEYYRTSTYAPPTYRTTQSTRNPYDFSNFGKETYYSSYIQSSTKNPYEEYALQYYKSSTLGYQYQGSQSIQHQVSVMKSQTDDTKQCADRNVNLGNGLTCRQFLERFGAQYCIYKYFQSACCASHRDLCRT